MTTKGWKPKLYSSSQYSLPTRVVLPTRWCVCVQRELLHQSAEARGRPVRRSRDAGARPVLHERRRAGGPNPRRVRLSLDQFERVESSRASDEDAVHELSSRSVLYPCVCSVKLTKKGELLHKLVEMVDRVLIGGALSLAFQQALGKMTVLLELELLHSRPVFVFSAPRDCTHSTSCLCDRTRRSATRWWTRRS